MIRSKTCVRLTLLLPLALFSARADDDFQTNVFGGNPVVAIGNNNNNQTAFTWTATKGFTDVANANGEYVYLPLLEGALYSQAVAISADGKVVVGASGTENPYAVFWKDGAVTDLTNTFGEFTPSYSFALAASQNGSVIAGIVAGYESQDSTAFRWTSAGSVLLQAPVGFSRAYYTGATLITPSGNAIAGYAFNDDNLPRAVLWKGSDIGVNLHPDIEAEANSEAIAINTDGSVVAIQVNTAYQSVEEPNASYAYRWSEGHGTVALGHLGTGSESTVRAMDAKGDVLVGNATYLDGSYNLHAFRWTETGGMQDLHSNTWSQGSSSAEFVSKDGAVVVGYAYNDGSQVFRWTAANGSSLLPSFGSNTYVSAITPDGRVIVGNGYNAEEISSGYRWTEKGGLQTIQQWLAASGVTLADTIHISSATAVSDDGSVVMGVLDSNDLYIAKGDAGLMTLADAQQSIAQTQAAVASIRTSANLVLNGAHGHPMSRRADAGRFITWAGGDYGQDDHGSRDGSVAVSEVGGGYNFGPTQLNLAVGRSDSRQDTEFSGDVKHTGTFLIADFITPIPNSPLVFTLTGIYQWSSLDTNRGYLNGGLPDMSSGDTDAQTYGGAARLDWVDAVKLKKFSVSPFGKVVLTESKIDAFTETGGGFPASYGEQTDTITDLHLGTNVTYILRKNLRLVGTLEAIHRVQDGASAGSVSIPGVTVGFAGIAGENYKQDWVSGGLGADYDIGAGTISFMLNASTDGPAPSAWIATSYLYKF